MLDDASDDLQSMTHAEFALWIPLSDEANRIVEKAISLGIEIENIVSLWGTKAIVNLHTFAKEFRHANV